MTRNQCYRLLGLNPGASETDIRRQYKRMALKVHPDINPDPKASEQFIQLTKAVEILLSPEPELTPSQQRQAQRQSATKTPETEAELKQRMEQAKQRYEQQKAQKIYENARYFKQLTSGRRWTIFKSVMLAGWLIALALILDKVLPTHIEKDVLVGYSPNNHNGLLFDKITAIELKETGTYFAESARGNWIGGYPDVQVEKSWLLHTPLTMYGSDDYTAYKTGFDFHLGAIWWLMAFAMLIPLFTYMRRKRDLTFVFMYQLSFWGIGLMAIYLLLTEKRLTHLLTLGFF